jgi:hypothetical protein
MTSTDFMAILATVAVAGVGAVTGLASYLSMRRAAHGKVDTSEAAVLWQQSQAIREMLLTEKTKAEEQRDRLIDAYTTQVFPALTEINTTVRSMADTVADMLRLLREMRSAEGGGHEAAAVAPPLEAPAGQR